MNRNDSLAAISQNIIELFGLSFPENRREDLERGVLAAATDLGIPGDLDSVRQWLSDKDPKTNAQMRILSAHLTIGETYFFREKSGLDLFQHKVIPDILAKRSHEEKYFRIWSAGCSSGEEPYTLAIILREMIPEIHNWNITILATDVSEKALQKASRGHYSTWSFRDTPESVRNKYFVSTGKGWEIIPEIKKMVSFSYLNLSSDIFPSMINNTQHMDVIFCRNVLMYFTPEKVREAGRKLHQCLVEGGWLVTSQVELNDDYFAPFSRVWYQKGLFYQKGNASPFIREPERVPVSEKEIKKSPEERRIHPSPVRSKPLDTHAKPVSSPVFPKANPVPHTLFEAGKYQECIHQALLLLQEKPEDTTLLLLLVKSYANMGFLEKAAEEAEKLVSISHTVDHYALYATVLMEMTEFEKAEISLKKLLYLDPDHLMGHLYLGNLLNRLGKKSQAKKHLQNVLELLEFRDEEETVPGSEGMTAGRIKEMVQRILQ